jgi:hypothetical protein
MTGNLVECPRCQGMFIGEEFEGHVCKKLKIIIFDSTGSFFLGSYDGINFFALPSPTESQQRNKTTEDSTEPKLCLQPECTNIRSLSY